MVPFSIPVSSSHDSVFILLPPSQTRGPHSWTPVHQVQPPAPEDEGKKCWWGGEELHSELSREGRGQASTARLQGTGLSFMVRQGRSWGLGLRVPLAQTVVWLVTVSGLVLGGPEVLIARGADCFHLEMRAPA